MKTKHSRRDLNLLPVFSALFREGSTTRAAGRLGITQSAVSHSLTRLRLLAKDELFVRSVEGMKPTARALELAGPIQEALVNVDRLFDPARSDSIMTATRFNLALTDYAAFLFLPELINEMRSIAPAVNFRARPNILGQSFDLMDKGEIDLAIGPYRSHPSRFGSLLLTEDVHVCVLRRNHPLTRGQLTLERFLEAKHVLVTLGEEERGIVDRALAQIGLKRNIHTTTNQFSAGLNIALQTDLMLTVPHHLAAIYRKQFALVIRPLPFPTDSTPLLVLWHSRLGEHPDNRRLIVIFQRIGERLLKPQNSKSRSGKS
jgi:DNA-binding transcriptional LysR family regulator